MRPMKGGNAKKVRAELITHTYVICTPVNMEVDGAACDGIILCNSAYVVTYFSNSNRP